MKHALPCLAALVSLVAAPALASDTSDVYGQWITEGGTAIVEIADCGPGPMAGTPCGVVASADIPEGAPTTDVNNQDPALRSKPIVGLTMLDGFEKKSGKWKSGRIYNPEDGKSYKSSVALDDDDADVLRVKGCIAFLCQTQKWVRVDGSTAPQPVGSMSPNGSSDVPR